MIGKYYIDDFSQILQHNYFYQITYKKKCKFIFNFLEQIVDNEIT